MPKRYGSSARPRLDVERIANAAVAIADKHGVAGFTIRAVAKLLHVTPMALYYHVKDKAALAELAVTASIKEHCLSAPTGQWQEDLCEMAFWIRRGALAHPAIHELQRSYRIFTPDVLRLADRWLNLWKQSGLDFENVMLAASTSLAAIKGLIAEESLHSPRTPSNTKVSAMLPNARLLLRASCEPKLTFDLGVRSVIDGLYSRLSSNVSIAVPGTPSGEGKKSRRS